MISKEDIKKVLVEWETREFPEIKERDIKINLSPTEIVSLTGVRRSGKTFLLLWIAKNLLQNYSKEEILYINFEHELLEGIDARDVRKIFEVHSELYNKSIKYVLFDEIQKVKNWKTLLRRLYDERKYKIFITGSSYELRPKELPSSLRGRTINYTIFPLSFKEFLRFKNWEIKEREILLEERKGKLLKYLLEFLKFGSFPDIAIKENEFEKIKLISSYFDTILLRDIIEKNEIRNVRLLELFIKYVLSISSFYFSATKVENYLKGIGERCSKATLLDFFEYAEKDFLIFKSEIFSPKVKDRTQYPVKVYCIDNGFINWISPRFNENIGACMENTVAIELLRRKEFSNTEFYYFRDNQGREVDFVIKEGLEIRQLLQVTYADERNEIEEREIKGLVKASELLGCKDLVCITWDFEGEEKVEGRKIKFLPLWKWLLKFPM